MSLEILDEHKRDPKAGVRGLANSLIALPGKHPIGWAVAWTVLLLALCLAPKRVMPPEESVSVKKYVPYTDLAVHLGLFAGFVVSWIRVGRRPLRWVVIPVIGLLLSVATEWAQGIPFINRDPSLNDALADGVGVVVGLVGSAILARASAGSQGTANPWSPD